MRDRPGSGASSGGAASSRAGCVMRDAVPRILILHAAWAPEAGRFYLWAEQPPGSRKGRASTAARRPHPFPVPAEALAQALDLEALPAAIVLRLPTRAGRPLPSPELARGTPPPTPPLPGEGSYGDGEQRAP